MVLRFSFFIAFAFGLLGCTETNRQTAAVLHEVAEFDLPEPELRYGFDFDAFHVVEGEFRPGDVLSKVLLPLGVAVHELEELVSLSQNVFDVRRIQPKKKWLTLFESDSTSTPSYFIFEKNARDYVVFSIKDSLAVWSDSKPTTFTTRKVSGRITHSLSKAMAEIGVPAELAIELSSIYAWTIDFYRLQKDDHFELLFEEELIDGETSGKCTILACSFTHGDRERKAYRFETEDGHNYYDADGESLRKAFLKAPVKYSRISSRFSGKRFHPVLKTYKAHLGTDYAAPHGTPIEAVGDGVVTEASFTSGNGNYVKIKHNGTYETQYLHMSKRAVKKGQRVQQGEVIGYVGSTGLATGPHVCFRFWKNGQQVDHLREEFPAADPVPNDLRDVFETTLRSYERMMNEHHETPDPTAEQPVL